MTQFIFGRREAVRVAMRTSAIEGFEQAFLYRNCARDCVEGVVVFTTTGQQVEFDDITFADLKTRLVERGK